MDLSLSAVWAVKIPMEALNGSAFLPLLEVLELLGLKISWFRIRVGETDLAMNVLEFESDSGTRLNQMTLPE